MNTYAIMQEAGPQAKRRAGVYGYARPNRRATVQARTQKEALIMFLERHYPTGHKQFGGSLLRYRTRAGLKRQHLDDGDDKTGREWEAEVRLVNGRTEHSIVLYAWRQ